MDGAGGRPCAHRSSGYTGKRLHDRTFGREGCVRGEERVKGRRVIACVLASFLVAALASAAALGNPNTQQYGNPAANEPTSTVSPKTTQPAPKETKNQSEQVEGALTPPTTPPPAVQAGATLPFTGQNIAVIVIIGGVLVAAGLGLRRARWHDR